MNVARPQAQPRAPGIDTEHLGVAASERKLYPNVDFYSGVICEAMDLPVDMFPVLFAIPRTAGWIAQRLEGTADPEQKIARPLQVYTGPRDRRYVPMGQRNGTTMSL